MPVKSEMDLQLKNNIHSEDNPFPAHEEHLGYCYKAATFRLHRSSVWSYVRSLETRIQVGFACDREGSAFFSCSPIGSAPQSTISGKEEGCKNRMSHSSVGGS